MNKLIPIILAGLLSTSLLSAEEEPAKAKPYPPDVCIVTGEKLGSMGEPFKFVHEGQEYKTCCEYCRPTFDKEPAKYTKKLEEK